MMSPSVSAARAYVLPPLILHPFSESNSPQKLIESSRANLMLQGLLPREEVGIDALDRIVLDGRYCEIRMLYYVGKDTARWIEQCLGSVERDRRIVSRGVSWESFAVLLIENPPAPVTRKLDQWGVSDHRAVFRRGLGLNSVFADVPPRELLPDGFLRNYHQYADQMFACRIGRNFARILPTEFDFELFSSGEYARMLEREWREG